MNTNIVPLYRGSFNLTPQSVGPLAVVLARAVGFSDAGLSVLPMQFWAAPHRILIGVDYAKLPALPVLPRAVDEDPDHLDLRPSCEGFYAIFDVKLGAEGVWSAKEIWRLDHKCFPSITVGEGLRVVQTCGFNFEPENTITCHAAAFCVEEGVPLFTVADTIAMHRLHPENRWARSGDMWWRRSPPASYGNALGCSAVKKTLELLP